MHKTLFYLVKEEQNMLLIIQLVLQRRIKISLNLFNYYYYYYWFVERDIRNIQYIILHPLQTKRDLVWALIRAAAMWNRKLSSSFRPCRRSGG